MRQAGKKRIRRAAALALSVVVAVLAIPFTASAAVQTEVEMQADVLHSLGLLSGSGGSYRLHRTLNRAEAITMLIHMMGEDQAVKSGTWTHPFTDVPEWAQAYVGYAYQHGLSSGISKTQFGSSSPCTQAQYLTFLLRALGYSDVRGDFKWSQPYDLAKSVGLISSETPLSRFTRGDMVNVSYRALSALTITSPKLHGWTTSSLIDSLQNKKKTLKDQLIEKGAFTKEAYEQAMAVYAEGPKTVKVVYLTFDDGPSAKVTTKILDTLQEYGVPATFFVLGKMVDRAPEIVQRAYNDGHKVATHGYSHDYKYLYANTKNLLADIKKGNEAIDRALGFAYGNRVFRFPGGSFGKSQTILNAVTKNGYTYYDWNCSGEDATKVKGSSAKEIVRAAINTSAGKKNDIIILLHDAATKDTTAKALPQIIEYFQEKGYVFRTLSE